MNLYVCKCGVVNYKDLKFISAFPPEPCKPAHCALTELLSKTKNNFQSVVFHFNFTLPSELVSVS